MHNQNDKWPNFTILEGKSDFDPEKDFLIFVFDFQFFLLKLVEYQKRPCRLFCFRNPKITVFAAI